MNQYIEVDDGNFIHLDTVKRLRHITDEERESLGKLENVQDPDKFSLRLDRDNGRKSYLTETIDEIAAQGVALVQVSDDTFVPRDNIIQTKNITPKDRENFMLNTGRLMPLEFNAQIETKAGKVLSPLDGKTVMKRMSAPYRAQTVLPKATPETDKGAVAVEPQGSLKDQKQAVLKNASPKVKSNGREHPRER